MRHSAGFRVSHKGISGQSERVIEVARSILVADDDPGILRVVRQALEVFLGAQVTTSSHPEYAFELALKMPFDLFVFDLQMPRLDGDLLYHLLSVTYGQAFRPPRPIPPLLLLTGHGADARARELLQNAGVRGILPKPFEIPRLVDKVQACLPTAN